MGPRGLATAAYVAAPALPWSDAGKTVVADLTLTVVPVGSGLACVLRARSDARARPRLLLLGLSCISWGIGSGIWAYLELVRGQFPFPSAADVGYLGAYPLAILALLAFPAAPARTVSRLHCGAARHQDAEGRE